MGDQQTLRWAAYSIARAFTVCPQNVLIAYKYAKFPLNIHTNISSKATCLNVSLFRQHQNFAPTCIAFVAGKYNKYLNNTCSLNYLTLTPSEQSCMFTQ